MTLSYLQNKCSGMWVKGLAGYAYAPIVRTDILADFLDLPKETIDDYVEKLEMPLELAGGISDPNIKVVNRYILEAEIYSKSVVGPKWAAIHYGITDQSLLDFISGLKNNGFQEDLCDACLNSYNSHKYYNPKVLEVLVASFLQSEGTTIFTNLTAMSDFLIELAKDKLQVNLTKVLDITPCWVELKFPTAQEKPDNQVATTFCSITGLPTSIARSEYLNCPKPGMLEPDKVAWFYLMENKSIRKMLMDANISRIREFEKRFCR